MKSYGEVSEKEMRTIGVLGCKSSLKDLVGQKMSFVGAILENDVKKSNEGEEYITNYVKIVETETGETSWRKFTQTIISSQLSQIFDNEINDLEYILGYSESASGNRYLCFDLA